MAGSNSVLVCMMFPLFFHVNCVDAPCVRYNGRPTSPPEVFPSEMEEACQLVEKVVNEVLKNRSRYPLEWGGTGTGGQRWKANVAISNCYVGKLGTFKYSIISLSFRQVERQV